LCEEREYYRVIHHSSCSLLIVYCTHW